VAFYSQHSYDIWRCAGTIAKYHMSFFRFLLMAIASDLELISLRHSPVECTAQRNTKHSQQISFVHHPTVEYHSSRLVMAMLVTTNASPRSSLYATAFFLRPYTTLTTQF